VAGVLLSGVASAESITGEYLEARNAEMWTGPCDHNAEIGLVGDKAIMAWKVRKGEHNGVRLDGLAIVAVVAGDRTFGMGEKLKTRTVFVIDGRANKAQRAALIDVAKALAGDTIQKVIAVTVDKVKLDIDHAGRSGYSRLDAGIAKIRTRRMYPSDHTCASERMVYPVLASVEGEYGAYALENEYSGHEFTFKFADNNACSAVIAKFSL
jgi:hypothetical protein